ncbi:MAG TPA: FAD-dependent oxidoreductase, partial [Tepidisphaeraceae bacterium]|nr:FAD-dependent oxidoreductase [Tepidisphaeraceae bacterium]
MALRDVQPEHRIVIIGGGFGGVYTAMALKKLCARRPDLRVTLVSRDNYFLMTPLLFEAGSGILEPRHAVNPIRPLFAGCDHVRFTEAEVTGVDFDRKLVRGAQSNGEPYEIGYDQLVIALGSVTNTGLVKGAEHAMTFKVMGDAIFVRNHVIDAFERADVERDPARRRALVTFVVIGGGLVGVELIGELTEFVHNVKRYYANVPDDEVR